MNSIVSIGIRPKIMQTKSNTTSHLKKRPKSSRVDTSRNTKTGMPNTASAYSGFSEEQSSLSHAPKQLTPSELSLREKLLRPKKDGMVRLSFKDLRRLPRLDRDLSAFNALTEEDIRRAVADDPDAAPLDMDWSKARMVTFKPKVAMSIRVDPDIHDYFKATGKGFQTRMNAVLRSYVDHVRKSKP